MKELASEFPKKIQDVFLLVEKSSVNHFFQKIRACTSYHDLTASKM